MEIRRSCHYWFHGGFRRQEGGGSSVGRIDGKPQQQQQPRVVVLLHRNVSRRRTRPTQLVVQSKDCPLLVIGTQVGKWTLLVLVSSNVVICNTSSCDKSVRTKMYLNTTLIPDAPLKRLIPPPPCIFTTNARRQSCSLVNYLSFDVSNIIQV